MKDEYLKVYQQRIEEIKTLDVSPEEKRKLAADAKTEILEQYKNSYIEEEKKVAKAPEVKPVQPVAKASSKIDEADPIGSLLNKFEERDDRGEVGIELVDAPSMLSDVADDEFLDPDALFETMNLSELLESLGIDDEDEDETSVGIEGEIPSGDLGNDFMDVNDLFGDLFDDGEDEDQQVPDLLAEFDLNSEDKPEEEQPETSEVSETAAKVVVDNASAVKVSLEADVDEVEELTQGTITDGDKISDDEDMNAVDLDAESIEELKELEKERERAQKLGVIEMALLVVLIILVIIVVRLYINIGV
ncbi:hypothetical protein RZE82_09405 [Mollicutes bacterium LVI A0039]|nr:hypothetical protein RZE82_09405 [Mollicutes bacterium LVI A0039]